jgi:hypothetical protein
MNEALLMALYSGYIIPDVRKKLTTTCISIRPDVLDAMKRLAELKWEQQGGFGRASVSATLSALALAELERLEAEQPEAKPKKRGARDA